ncbi:sugar O-acetyltransferase [Pediococcus cellicola]|uniref:Acetyltransferase n=1 Tax=Pediococcus cellicola TaxID=319652 RepID=A0A0R2IVT7_9LACO|nr:sugar O-acetyltransferase [Pediococcus cellicola]KRN65860.1 maltose O-acetyltransferase [Pediococcus cellicola]GEL15674.1 galactoside O-acetyltransferase [Pediococcus cellicola]
MQTDRELMNAGQLYNSNDSELIALRRAAKQKIYQYNQTHPEQQDVRQHLLDELLDCPSADPFIEVPTRMDYGYNVHIGKRFYANYDSIFLDIAPIVIGNNVMLGPRVSLYTAGHPIVPDIRNQDLEYGHPITIGNDVWIGGNAVICPGVTIGNNVVIGAGTIVTKDIPDNSVAVGNPGHVIRQITAADQAFWENEKSQYLKRRGIN